LLRIATAFSGVGTPELALKELKVPFKNIFACEIDKFTRTSYLTNNEPPKTFYKDIKEIDGNLYKNQIDLFVWGFPCTSFSIAGKQLSFNDPNTGDLFFQGVRLMKEMKPKFAIIENVKGLLSIDKGNSIKTVLRTLASLGYEITFDVLNTKYIKGNVPQSRERIYIICQLGKSKSKTSSVKHKRCLSILKELEIDEFYDFQFPLQEALPLDLQSFLEESPDEGFLIDRKGNKGSVEKETIISKTVQPFITKNFLRDMREIKKTDKGFFRCNVTSGYQDNCIGLKHISTLRANNSNAFIYDLKNNIFRKLTPRECFNLQGFPRNFVMNDKISNTQLYKQAGNAMSFNVIKELLISLLRNIRNELHLHKGE